MSNTQIILPLQLLRHQNVFSTPIMENAPPNNQTTVYKSANSQLKQYQFRIFKQNQSNIV